MICRHNQIESMLFLLELLCMQSILQIDQTVGLVGLNGKSVEHVCWIKCNLLCVCYSF